MLVSVASFLPIIVVGPVSDLIGTGTVIFLVAIFIGAAGVASIIQRGPLRAAESASTADTMVPGAAVEPIGIFTHAEPVPFDPSGPDDEGIAPWMRAAGWGRPTRPVPADAGPQGDRAAQQPSHVAADPLGLVPDDPEALARAQTVAIEIPWAAEEAAADREAPPHDPDALPHDRDAAGPEPPRRG
jgi:hypothetical protein